VTVEIGAVLLIVGYGRLNSRRGAQSPNDNEVCYVQY